MSKLSERMRRSSRAEARPVGLVRTTTTAQPTMLVIAEAGAKDAAAAAGSADAVLLAADAGADAIAAAAAGGLPVGMRVAKADRARAAELREAGVDFLVLTDESSASALMDEEISYILDVPGEPTDTDLRALDALPLEAILTPKLDTALTIRGSINLRRFVAFARKPLMLPVDPAIDAADLEALRELNVLLLLVPAAGAAKLRDAVSALPPRRHRRTDRGVGVPSMMFGSPRVEEPDEDGDDE